MSVEYILDRFGKKVGMLPSDDNQRSLLLDYLNEAAQELYEQSDMPGSLEEAEFYVQGDKTIAMPADVYAIRGIREKSGGNDVWESEPMTARYRENSWETDHNKFRIKGYSALQRSLPTTITGAGSNANKLSYRLYGPNTSKDTIVIVANMNDLYDEEVKVSASGRDVANNSGYVTLSFSGSSNPIKDIKSFSRTRPLGATGSYTNPVTGITGEVAGHGLAQLVDYTDNSIVYAEIKPGQEESRYLIVDVSEFPFSSSAAQDDQHTLQVLYKKTLPIMRNDRDEFPAPGYDNILVSKCMELFLEEQGKLEEAILHDRKASRSLARRQADLERSQEQKVVFKRHNHDKLTWLATHRRRS
tara:strand:+ start:66 stop:1139 length:1074 start_codon:yes stop_codon:yes gene_type:complete